MMKVKKYPRSDLDKKRLLFLTIGFTFAFAAVLTAFEWRTFKGESRIESTYFEEPYIEEDHIPVKFSLRR